MTVASGFIRHVSEYMHAQAKEAIDCFAISSWLGVRQNLASLRSEAERSARIECHVLHRSSNCNRLRKEVDLAMAALDTASKQRLGHALHHILVLAKSRLTRERRGAAGSDRHQR